MQIFLTSQGFYSNFVKDRFSGAIADLPFKRCALITTAAEGKENNQWVLKDRDTLIEMGFDGVNLIDLETNPTVDLSLYNVFFVEGGNTFKLLKAARESNFKKSVEDLLKRGGIYFGISAGSLIMCPDVSIANEVTPDANEVGLTDFTGLNLVKEIIYPHYTPNADKELRDFENKHKVKVTKLADDQALIL